MPKGSNSAHENGDESLKVRRHGNKSIEVNRPDLDPRKTSLLYLCAPSSAMNDNPEHKHQDIKVGVTVLIPKLVLPLHHCE